MLVLKLGTAALGIAAEGIMDEGRADKDACGIHPDPKNSVLFAKVYVSHRVTLCGDNGLEEVTIRVNVTWNINSRNCLNPIHIYITIRRNYFLLNCVCI